MSQDKNHVAAQPSLDDLILPGTPEQVADAYRTLAERAKTASPGMRSGSNGRDNAGIAS